MQDLEFLKPLQFLADIDLRENPVEFFANLNEQLF